MTQYRPAVHPSSSSANENGSSKFPASQLGLLALVRVAEPIALTSIFPYAWKLVLQFHVGDESNASFYAGILVAAFAFAEAISGMFWGGLSDRIGRKPVLIMGCLGTIASLLVVGFSLNFWMAFVGRLLGGALNGNIGVIQTMVGELVVNPKHEPRAYAVMPFIWSVGTIIGPCIGGYFATPVEGFPGTILDNALFAKYPFLLPNLICVALMSLSIAAAWLFLEETHPDMVTVAKGEDVDAHKPLIPRRRLRADSSIMATQPTDTTPAVNLTQESYGTFNAVSEEAVEEEWNLRPDGTERRPSTDSSVSQKALTRRVVMLTVALGIFTYHSMTYDHLLPIFAQDERVIPNDHFQPAAPSSSYGSLAGGLGLSIKDVGFIMSVNGIIALFVQAVIFPILASFFSIWHLFVMVTILHPTAYFVVPWVALLSPSLLYPGVYAALAMRNLYSILAYPLLLILIKEASPGPQCLGKINGLAASTGAGCRTMASPIAGFLYGVGIKRDFVAVAWWASTGVAVAGALQLWWIPREGKHAVEHHVEAAHWLSHERGTDEEQQHRPRRKSVVRIRVADSGYNSGAEE